MIRRRPTQIFSLAFLDCICCGFGAVILIFVLSIDSQEKEKLEALADLRKVMAAQLLQVTQLKNSKEELDRSNSRVATLVTDSRLRNDSLHALLDDLERKLQMEKRGQEALLVDIDELKKEFPEADMQELVAKADVRIAAEIIKRREQLEKDRIAAAENPPVIDAGPAPEPIGAGAMANGLL
jgi:superfamily II helicase